jgi:hypothetical protein
VRERCKSGGPDGRRLTRPRRPAREICADPSAAAPPYRLVQQIFDDNCTSCHVAGAMVNLLPGSSWSGLVGKPAPAPDSCGGTLVVPGQPSASYLFQKLTTATPCYGFQMRLGEFASFPLPACVTAIVGAWIAEGAPPPAADAGTD